MYAEETVKEGMDNPFVEKFESFFKDRCMKDIERLVEDYPEKRSLMVDSKDIEHYDTSLADEILVNPDVCLEAARQAIKSIDVPMLEIGTSMLLIAARHKSGFTWISSARLVS